MWHTSQLPRKTDQELSSAVLEFKQSIARHVIFATGGVYLAWYIVVAGTWPTIFNWRLGLITAVIGLTSAACLLLLPRHFHLSQPIWQAGLALAITLALHFYHRPESAFLFALLPFMGVVCGGWQTGLAAEALLIVLLGWLSSGLSYLPEYYALSIACVGALSGLVGWAALHAMTTVTEWYLFSFKEAQENMQSARQHRAQLARALKGLDQAFSSLERANTALVAAWKSADDAERLKTEFVTNVSHELRTPLNLILGFSEMIVTSPESYDDAQLPGAYRGDMNAICHSARHLLALVDDVLDLARIEAGKIALAREETELAPLVDEATEMVREYLAAKGLELRMEIAPNLPRVWLDRLRVRQVLLNLMVNAARFTEHGSITVAATLQDDDVEVRVTDTGRGIPPEDMQKVFEEFRSTQQPVSEWHSGTGLGLPISKKFVELHGGQMGVESTYLQGASFWFRLPCTATLPLGGTTGASGARLPVSPREQKPLVVIVHEDPHVAPLLQRYLEGYQVVGVGDSREGLATADRYVALITDAAHLPPESPGSAIVLTCPLPSGSRAAAAIGAEDLLVKPVSRSDLMAALDRLNPPVRRMLIADHDPDMVRLFRRMLRTRISAQDCLEAHNGAEALELARREKPDLVLLDLAMPEVDGSHVTELMANDPDLAGIPVIIVSAKDEPYMTAMMPGPIQITRAGGFELGEIVRVLEAVLSTLTPGWQNPDSTVAVPQAKHPGLQVLVDSRQHPATEQAEAR